MPDAHYVSRTADCACVNVIPDEADRQTLSKLAAGM